MVVARTGSTTELASLALRGSNPDEVLIYVDGVPLNIAEGGGVDISTLPLGDVERVEVYRGTTPLAFGEAALGGVVSITTRTPGATRAQARAAVGSFGTMFGDLSGGGRVGRLRFYLGAHVYSSQGDYPFLYNPTPAVPGQRGARHPAEQRRARGERRAAVGAHAERAPDVEPGRDRVRAGTGAAGTPPATVHAGHGAVSQRAWSRVPALRIARRSRSRGTAVGPGLRQRRARSGDRSGRRHLRAGADGHARDDRLDGRDGVRHAAARRMGTCGRRARSAARDLHPGRRARPDDVGRSRPGGWSGWPAESSTCAGAVWTFTSFLRPASS